MKRILQLSVLVFAVLLCFNNDAFAQRKKKKKKSETDEYFDESGGFKHRLWYGGNILPNFSSRTDGFGLRESTFTLGLTPMIGYKVLDNLSFGPRFTILYQYYVREFSPGESDGINLFSYGAGAFGRYKFFQNIFIHGEYEYLNAPANVQLTNREWEVVNRISFNNVYAGIGYNSNSGGPFGFEFLLLYNLNIPDNTFLNPFDFRAGFTYNF